MPEIAGYYFKEVRKGRVSVRWSIRSALLRECD
jgi:hypothetical protein